MPSEGVVQIYLNGPKKKIPIRAGEIVGPEVKSTECSSEDPGWLPNTHMEAHNYLQFQFNVFL